MGRRWWVGVAALACVVAGCGGGEGDPGGSSTPSVTVSESPTAPSTTGAAGAVAPTLPPEAAGEDAAAAEAFVRFYWEMADYAQATGDVSGLRRLAAEKCLQCAAALEFVEDVYARGGEIRGGASTLSGLRTVPLSRENGSAFQAQMKLRTQRQTVDLPGSRDDTTHSPGEVSMQMVVERDADQWVIAFWDAS